jgi:hypothetical protein
MVKYILYIIVFIEGPFINYNFKNNFYCDKLIFICVNLSPVIIVLKKEYIILDVHFILSKHTNIYINIYKIYYYFYIHLIIDS